MHEGLLNAHYEDEVGSLPVYSQQLLENGVANDLALAADAKRVAIARYQEVDADLGIEEQILKSIEPSIAQTIRDRQRLAIQDVNKAGSVTLRGKIKQTVLAA